MRPIPMVRANSAILCFDFLEEIGAPAQRLLEQAGISPGILEHPERLLPLHQTLSFLGRAASTQGLPDFGLRAALATQFGDLGAYAQLICGALTVYEALHRLILAIKLYDSGAQLWLDLGSGDDTARFCHAHTTAQLPCEEQGELFAIAMMIQAVRVMLCRRTWHPQAVMLTNMGACYRSHLEALLGVPVHCAGECRAIVFRRSLLAERLGSVSGAPACFQDGYQWLRSTAPADDFVGSVRQAIASLTIDRYPNAALTADAVGLSPRTLQRRLAEEGETYFHLVEAVRFEVASELLRDRDAKIIDIAYEMGYTDAANFTRAFRRWAGIGPRAFRRAEGLSAGVLS